MYFGCKVGMGTVYMSYLVLNNSFSWKFETLFCVVNHCWKLYHYVIQIQKKFSPWVFKFLIIHYYCCSCYCRYCCFCCCCFCFCCCFCCCCDDGVRVLSASFVEGRRNRHINFLLENMRLCLIGSSLYQTISSFNS